MKKYLFGFLASVVVLLIACDNTVSGNGSTVDNIPDETLAKVVVQLPKTGKSGRVGLAASKEHTDTYEVYFRRDDSGVFTYYSRTATNSDQSITLDIPAGTYDILLLAGHIEWDVMVPRYLLLASSYQTDRSIIRDGINMVSLELATVDVDISCPASVEAASAFNIDLTVNTKNPYIVLPENGSFSGTLYHHFGYMGDESGPIEYGGISNNGNVYTIKFPLFTAPTSAEPRMVKAKSSIRVTFSDNADSNGINRTWYLANCDDTVLGSFYKKTINFIDGAALPSVSVDITWPDE